MTIIKRYIRNFIYRLKMWRDAARCIYLSFTESCHLKVNFQMTKLCKRRKRCATTFPAPSSINEPMARTISVFICVFCGRKNICVSFVYIRVRQKLRVFVSLCSVKYPCFRAAPYQGAQNVISLRGK